MSIISTLTTRVLRTLVFLGLFSTIAFQSNVNAMSSAFEMGRVFADKVPEIAGTVAAGAAAIYESVRNKDRSSNFMPSGFTQQTKYDSGTLDDMKSLSDSVKEALTKR